MESIGVVVCTLNSELSIAECLNSLRTAGVNQIVVVDGGSIDMTLSIIRKLGIDYYEDPGLGLGLARNIGVDKLLTDYALILGSDNSISTETIQAMLLKIKEGYVGVSCRTRTIGDGYLSRCINQMWLAKIQSGEKITIGTPQLFSTSVLKKYPFSLNHSYSDDTELCTRLSATLNAKFYTVPNFCNEHGKATLEEIRKRYRIYGLSDWEIYKDNSRGWGVSRKLSSWLHPFRTEFYTYIRRQAFSVSIVNSPITIYVTYLRYKSWVSKILSSD